MAKIVIVDQGESFGGLLVELLRLRGHQATSFNSFAEAKSAVNLEASIFILRIKGISLTESFEFARWLKREIKPRAVFAIGNPDGYTTYKAGMAMASGAFDREINFPFLAEDAVQAVESYIGQ